MTVKGHVDIGAVALRGVGEGCVGAADAAEGGSGAVGQDGSGSRNYVIVVVGVLVVLRGCGGGEVSGEGREEAFVAVMMVVL